MSDENLDGTLSDLDLLTQSLARSVKRWRTERGFTLEALAARAGVSRGMLIQIEQTAPTPASARS